MRVSPIICFFTATVYANGGILGMLLGGLGGQSGSSPSMGSGSGPAYNGAGYYGGQQPPPPAPTHVATFGSACATCKAICEACGKMETTAIESNFTTIEIVNIQSTSVLDIITIHIPTSTTTCTDKPTPTPKPNPTATPAPTTTAVSGYATSSVVPVEGNPNVVGGLILTTATTSMAQSISTSAPVAEIISSGTASIPESLMFLIGLLNML